MLHLRLQRHRRTQLGTTRPLQHTEYELRGGGAGGGTTRPLPRTAYELRGGGGTTHPLPRTAYELRMSALGMRASNVVDLLSVSLCLSLSLARSLALSLSLARSLSLSLSLSLNPYWHSLSNQWLLPMLTNNQY